MSKKLSETASSLIAILHNINELVVKSSDRKNAADVMRALRVYAKNKNYSIPEDKVDNFLSVLLDARPYTLTCIVKDIASDIVEADTKKK